MPGTSGIAPRAREKPAGPRPGSGRALLLGALLGIGCAGLPWPEGPPRRAVRVEEGGLLDLRGAVHLHTRDSHDSSGNIGDLAEAARETGLSWVALSEHSKPGGPPARGVLRGVTIIPGFEFRAGGGSLLALGLRELPRQDDDLPELVRDIHAAGGAAFLAHIESSRLLDPASYQALGVDGIELVNLHATAEQVGYLSLVLRGLLLPAPLVLRALVRTPTRNLALWDALPAARSIVGGVDAHVRIRLLGPAGEAVDSYRRMFRLLTTHVWAADASPAAILGALRQGHSYIAFEALGRVDRFHFARRGASFELRAPAPAHLVLTCDGRHAGARDGIEARLPVPDGAHLCRGEAWRARRLWIITSYQEAGGASPGGRARLTEPRAPGPRSPAGYPGTP